VPVSVHDNHVYAQVVDYERCCIVLHTVYPHANPHEFTDIRFEGVIVHHFEQQKMSGGPNPAVVLFDVEECDPGIILAQYTDLLARTKNYGWPASYNGIADLVSQLMAGGTRCFEIHGTCGLQGFVFAARMEFQHRTSRAEVVSAAPLGDPSKTC
jgi:hypothetical protein